MAKRFKKVINSMLLIHRNLKVYLVKLINEFKALGRDVVITKKEKKNQTNIEKLFKFYFLILLSINLIIAN